MKLLARKSAWLATACFIATLFGCGQLRDERAPSDKVLRQMCRRTLLDFHRALKTAEFEVFYATVSEAWQENTTPGKMAETYLPLMKLGVDLAPVVRMDPTFEPAPHVDDEEILHVQGWYAMTPRRVYFHLKYILEDGVWKPYGVSVQIN